jgi:hypothetical protein
MKNKAALFSAITLFSLIFTVQSFAQALDSIQVQKSEQQMLREREQQNKQRLDNAADLKKETKSNARIAKGNANEARAVADEAKRIENDASDAAKQARKAARMEAKAQRNRNDADKQARKAGKANQKSINN